MTVRNLSAADVLDVCALMLKRCGLTVAQLAKHTGQAPAVVVEAPKPERDPDAMSPLRAQVLGLCDCADGMSVADLMTLLGIGMQTAFVYLDDLRELGKVTKARPQGVRADRYFARPAHALAWVESHSAPPSAPPTPSPSPAPARVELSPKEALTLRTNIAKKAAAHKAEPMPQRKVIDKKAGPPDLLRYTAGDSKVAKPAKDAPVDESRAKRTVAPTPVPVAAYQRLELAPDPRWPSFSSAPLGVNPDTGKAWGAAA